MAALADEEKTVPFTGRLSFWQILWAAVFLFASLELVTHAPDIRVAWVSGILLLTIYLFVFEVVGVDVAAISVMVLLGLTSLFAPLMGLEQGLVDNHHLFDGFASNAVISIIAVMIIGAGLDRTGIMGQVAALILKVGGTSEKRVIPIISATVGFISSFMQNVGATALFLPVVSRVSARSGLPMSRLLMPMGFTAILGGTMTMVGSSPLILLNDLILTSNKALPGDQQMETWGVFAVTPIGVALVIAGILYFVIAGRYVLPKTKTGSVTTAADSMQYFREVYGVNYAVQEVVVPEDSSLVGMQLDDVETAYRLRVIATCSASGEKRIATGSLSRDTAFERDMVLGVVAAPEDLDAFIESFRLRKRSLITFASDLSSQRAGIAEVVIPPGSGLVGKSARDVWMRKTYGLAMIALHRGGKTLREGEDIRSLPFMAGDTLVVHTHWDALQRVEKDKDFVVITTEYPHEALRPHKVVWAALFFAIAIGLELFTHMHLSVALMTGAIGMVLSGVLKIEEAYAAVSWKTVFLLASLIPLGLAVETSGTAKWMADAVLSVVGHMPLWVIQLSVATLATFFTLVMSNVGATVLLVPLAVNIAIGAGANPAVFALTVAIATSNSFLIPTHQVNALIMGPGGYRVVDYIRAGGIMTVLFLVVMTLMMNLLF